MCLVVYLNLATALSLSPSVASLQGTSRAHSHDTESPRVASLQGTSRAHSHDTESPRVASLQGTSRAHSSLPVVCYNDLPLPSFLPLSHRLPPSSLSL